MLASESEQYDARLMFYGKIISNAKTDEIQLSSWRYQASHAGLAASQAGAVRAAYRSDWKNDEQ